MPAPLFSSTPVAPTTQTSSQLVPVNLAEIDQKLNSIGETAFVGISNLSQQMLSSIRASDDDFGIKLNQLVATSKGLDPTKFQQKGVVAKVRNMFSSTKERMFATYATVEQQMDSLLGELNKSADHHKNRINDFEEMYVQNYNHHENLEVEVERGKQLRLQLEDNLLEAQKNTEDAFSVQIARDVQTALDRLNKRIDDMQRGMLMSKQLAPQIRQNQENARSLVVTFADVQHVTIPAWKNAFGLYLTQLEQKKGAELANSVYDMTDEALRRQADAFKQNTTQIASVRHRPIASIETLTHMQQQLIGAFDELAKIDEKARQDRKNSEQQLKALEDQLIQKFVPKAIASK